LFAEGKLAQSNAPYISPFAALMGDFRKDGVAKILEPGLIILKCIGKAFDGDLGAILQGRSET